MIFINFKKALAIKLVFYLPSDFVHVTRYDLIQQLKKIQFEPTLIMRHYNQIMRVRKPLPNFQAAMFVFIDNF